MRSRALPIRVESLSVEGAVLLTSTTRRAKSVSIVGMSPLAFPKMPTLVDITDPAGTASVKLAFDAFETLPDGAPPRVFDLEQLTTHLGPDRIEGDAR